MRRQAVRSALLAAVCALTPCAVLAASVTLTDCASPPVAARAGSTVVDVRPNDLVIRCALAPLAGTGRVLVYANRIAVEGPDGSIHSPGRGLALQLTADADISLRSTSLEASNGNGIMRLLAGVSFDVRNAVLTVGDADRPGQELRLQCTAPGCAAALSRSNLRANRVKLLLTGNLTAELTTIATRGPRDRILLRSLGGDILYGQCGNALQGHNEGKVRIEAYGDVDLSGTQVITGEDITVQAGLGGSGSVTLRNATLRNDFGKPGDIEIEAARGAGAVDIEGATLIDDDRPARVNDMSEINGREQAPHEGFNNTSGRPRLDT